MSLFDRARRLRSEAEASGEMGTPWEDIPHRWRVSADVFEGLKEQADGWLVPVAHDVQLRLLGLPIDVIGDLPPDTMRLEPAERPPWLDLAGRQ